MYDIDYMNKLNRVQSTPQSMQAIPDYSDIVREKAASESARESQGQKLGLLRSQVVSENQTDRDMLNTAGSQNRIAIMLGLGNVGLETYRAHKKFYDDLIAQETYRDMMGKYNALEKSLDDYGNKLRETSANYPVLEMPKDTVSAIPDNPIERMAKSGSGAF